MIKRFCNVLYLKYLDYQYFDIIFLIYTSQKTSKFCAIELRVCLFSYVFIFVMVGIACTYIVK